MLAFGFAVIALDRAFPPPDPGALVVSATVEDRDGRLLRAFVVPGGEWRLPVKLGDVDPLLAAMTVAYEDRRFRYHPGIDPLATLRAGVQMLRSGRIVSGGSTLTMQLARLLEPRQGRSVGAKLRQLARALQLEERFSKDDILAWYLTLAPYGGNLEGVRAASLAYFGKEPKKLTIAEAALLVALPQAPESRRPDRGGFELRAARARVLNRMVAAGVLSREEAAQARDTQLPALRGNLPVLAAHASLRAVQGKQDTRLTISRAMQEKAEAIAGAHVRALGARLSAAVIIAGHRSGEILARVGSAGLFDQGRWGWIDMTRAIRSPGSALKPFIYGLAFDNGIAAPETLIEDRPANFGGYRPKNFTDDFRGTVSASQALQLSLNIPAVKLLDAVGPLRLVSAFQQAGVVARLPRDASPTLAVALGGVGVTLEQLVTLYTALPRGGTPISLREMAGRATERRNPLFGPAAASQVSRILSGTPPPDGARGGRIAYKTGTSYGFRDAWAVGFDGQLVIGVWVGRPDGTAVSDLTGRQAAAPILFELFDAVQPERVPLAQSPSSTEAQPLPPTMARFDRLPGSVRPGSAPSIIFPPEGAELEPASDAAGAAQRVILKVQGGQAPFSWLANGKPIDGAARRRQASWRPDGVGYAQLTVIDAAGRSDSVRVLLRAME